MLPQPGEVDLSCLKGVVGRANEVSRELSRLSDEQLREQLERIPKSFATSDDWLSAFLAVVRELAQRRVGLRPFDVQLQAAAAMLRGTSVELATGKGKTLTGAIVAVGLAHEGLSVHVLSANDYLAQRDADWMGPLLEASGVSVAAVTSRTPRSVRRAAYRARVVYIPVTEAGFDVLRERLVLDERDLIGIGADAAILDEADAVLLDEARVPLALAGEAIGTVGASWELADLAAELDETLHYEVDADRRTLHLTEEGLQRVEASFPGADLFGSESGLLTRMHVALHAEALLVRDVDYVVENGRLRLVSQSRGRVEALQRWPEGLQEAVEAKERLEPSAAVEVLDQLLVRDLLDLYPRMIGMSATLVSAAEELDELYGLRIGALSPNRPCIRADEPDRLFDRLENRDAAAVEFIRGVSRSGQPVLVATQSVAESERLAALLNEAGLQSVVLNAKNDKEEAAIIARAGEQGRITVSTQMAGRGTDIRLGSGVADKGGLTVVGLSRFPSRRLDDQLRGRAGRQGDPGCSVFFVSLEDDLIAANAPGHPLPRRIADDGSVQERRLADVPDHAQRIADGEARELRRLARRYGMLLTSQRQEVLRLRRELLTTDLAWRDLARRLPERSESLRACVRQSDLVDAARLVLLSCLDKQWTDHLGYAAELREGIHLRALAREDPLTEFSRLMRAAFRPLVDDAYQGAETILNQASVIDGVLDLDTAGLKRPGATWTYMVTDNQFGSEWERIGKFVAREIRLAKGH